MEKHQVYSQKDVETEVGYYLDGVERDKLDYILDKCSKNYKQLEPDDQIEFKSVAKMFCRTYSFLGAILPYGNAEWEKLSILLNLLIPKLPSPATDDLSKGILETIDLDAIQMKGYGFQIEMKYTAYRLGFKIKEVPIVFINRQLGTSKMSSGIFGEAFWGVIKLRFRKILPKKA